MRACTDASTSRAWEAGGIVRLVASLLAVLVLAGCGGSVNKATGSRAGRPVVLTLANWESADTDVGEWIDSVERLSRGTLKIQARGGWRRGQLYSDRGTLDDVRAGRVDIAHIPTRAWDTFGVAAFQVLEAPLLIDSLELERRILTSPLVGSLLSGVRAAGVEPLALLPGPLRRPVGVSRDLLGPADYRGARIALRPSALHEMTFRALGAQPHRVAIVERLRGSDGVEADFATMGFGGYDRQARAVTADVVLWPRFSTLVINPRVWGRLSVLQRTALSAAGQASLAVSLAQIRAADAGSAQSLCDGGLLSAVAGPSRIASLRRAVAPVYERLSGNPAARAALARVRELKRALPSDPAPACVPATQPRRAPAGSELLGRWAVTVSLPQIKAAHRQHGETPEENWGAITLDLGADGRFALLNARYPNPVGLGSWSVAADELTF